MIISRTRAATFSTFLLAASLNTFTSAPALAQQASEPRPFIAVTGTGTSTIAPDMAVINLQVVREADTAREALDANTKATGAVLASLKEAGIEDRDLQTSNFSIQPRYYYPPREKDGRQKPPRITGYIVSNALTVRIRNLDNVGAILDRSVTLGVNSGGHITFTNSDTSKVIEDARRKAMEDAIAKAQLLSQTAGTSLGRVLQITEQNRGTPRPRGLARAAKFEAADAVAVPVAAGENSYSVMVNVRWALEQ